MVSNQSGKCPVCSKVSRFKITRQLFTPPSPHTFPEGPAPSASSFFFSQLGSLLIELFNGPQVWICYQLIAASWMSLSGLVVS